MKIDFDSYLPRWNYRAFHREPDFVKLFVSKSLVFMVDLIRELVGSC
jgi:hypothetical protein